jgi:hypothetical protein
LVVVAVWTGEETRALRTALRLTIEAFAEQLGVAVRTVAKWEAQGSSIVPVPMMQEVLDVALQRATPEQHSRFVMLRPGVGTRRNAPSSPTPEPVRLDLVALARLRERVDDLGTRYDRTSSISLLAEAGQCLGEVVFLRSQAVASRMRRELYALEAETATLMGQLVWDASQRRDHATARAYFDQAIEAAEFLGDPAAQGMAMLRKTFVALYGEADPKTGLSLAIRTAETTDATSRVLTGLALAHAAEAHAMLGSQRDCELALAQAESRFDRIDASDAAIDLFSPAQHSRLAGSCYLFLGKAKRAQPILERTAGALEGRSKSQAIVLGNLALACIRQRSLDEGAAALHRAIDVVERTWGGGGLNIAFRAGRELGPWRHVPVVRDVCDRLLGLMAAS